MIATGLARGASAKGKRIAFGDGRKIIWDRNDHELFRGNPNIAKQGSERDSDIEWVHHYGGHRLYGSFAGGKWHWKPFKCIEGEVFLSEEERNYEHIKGHVIIEPRTKNKVNKDWGRAKYQQLADRLANAGIRCVQLVPPKSEPLLRNVRAVYTPTFRHALGALERADLYAGPEGGLHHGAAAVGTRAIVIYGAFISPTVTGYDWHRNVFREPACGSPAPCAHCKMAMESITVDEVFGLAMEELAK